MRIERVEKKLREARFFLGKMMEHERLAFNDKEPVDFYLNAFLNAARTVDYRLRHNEKDHYLQWPTNWNANLSGFQRQLIKFMVDDRGVEVMEPGKHSLAVGTIEVLGAAASEPPSSSIRVPTFSFTIERIELNVAEACGEYLDLLDRMVAAFQKQAGI